MGWVRSGNEREATPVLIRDVQTMVRYPRWTHWTIRTFDSMFPLSLAWVVSWYRVGCAPNWVLLCPPPFSLLSHCLSLAPSFHDSCPFSVLSFILSFALCTTSHLTVSWFVVCRTAVTMVGMDRDVEWECGVRCTVYGVRCGGGLLVVTMEGRA